MTNHDAIVSSLYPYDVDDSLIEKVCIDYDLDDCDDYCVAYRETVARVTVTILTQMLKSISSESNNGYSLSYSEDGLRERIYSIAKYNGFNDIVEEYNPKPQVFINCD